MLKPKKTILLVGNVSSGKTTICSLVAKQLGYRHINIDQIRNEVMVEHQLPTYKLEDIAKKRFFMELYKDENQVVESIAYGHQWNNLQKTLRLSRADVFTVKLEVPLEVCLDRFYTRQKSFFPYPIDPDIGMANIERHLQYVKADMIFDRYKTPQEYARIICERYQARTP